MKKLILLIFIVFLNANEIELFEKLFPELLNKKIVHIYTKKYLNINSSILKIVNDCQKADIVIGELECNKPKFLLDYHKYKKDKSAIGAFYWRKGRPQLRLRESSLVKYHLFISNDFKDYIE